MKQKNSRMIAEVNKLIGNTLTKDGGVYLPTVGSLSVTTTLPSMNEASNGDSTPMRSVSLSEDERHRNITTIISERGNCTPKQADLIYKKWLEAVSESGEIDIDSVGVISKGVFTSSDSLKLRLNPVVLKPKVSLNTKSKGTKQTNKGAKSEKSETKSRSFTLIICLLIAAVVAGVVFALYCNKPTDDNDIKSEVVEPAVKPQIEESKVEDVAVKEPKTEDVAATEQKAEQKVEIAEEKEDVANEPTIAPSSVEVSTSDEILQAALKAGVENSDLHYKVIYGAFSNSQNVAKAIAMATKTMSGKISCTVYQHGKSYIVSLYDAKSIDEAKEFVTNNKEKFTESLWIHKR